MIKLVGIPFDLNSSYLRGPATAPHAIRNVWKEGSANDFSESGIDAGSVLNDEGDLKFDSDDIVSSFRHIKSTIENLLKADHKVISLGGDHSITFPVIQAFAKKYDALHILHIDAHADLYDEYDGNKFSHACPFARIMENRLAASLTQVGIRTLNTHQREQAVKFGVKIIEMKDYNTDFLHQLKSPLYISLDLDALDPAFAPGISHHEPGGFSTRALIHLIQSIKVPLVGADIVEYNPLRDLNNMTAMVAFKFMKELAAKMMGA